MVLLGRSDFQIKVRGFLVDMPEVEAALRSHPGIRDALIHPATEESGQRRLIAYVVPEGKNALMVDELRSFLAPRLADYMIPAAFVELPSIPLMPNGKVDRGALPLPPQNRPKLSTTYQAPGTPIEKALSGIWAETLGLPRVGIHDNLFDLGGHSLLAAQAVNRINQELESAITLRHLFDTPTVSGLALVVLEQLLTSHVELDFPPAEVL